ncbi:hypothetical protein pipiens_010691 [Culex pipiens pipiens]|uniref:Uncharacterized protein n=1 Tax=Culex pipiens pipiens TaxID=38569 RepID=A0ABD1D949_CULPP
MGKIVLTLLAIAVCADATFNVGSLLGLLRPPVPRVAHPPPVPVYPAAPVQPGYASYYRQAPQVPQARVVNQPVVYAQRPAAVSSYYRQPVATPQVTSIVIPPAVQTTSTVLSTSFTGQQQPLSFGSFGSQEPLSFASFGSQEPLNFGSSFGSQEPLKLTSFGSQEPLSFTSFGSQEPLKISSFGSNFGSQQPISFTDFGSKAPEPAISITPSNSLSFSFADSAASSAASAGSNAYSVETVKSEGHSYSLAPEHYTVEKTIAPVTTIESFEEAHHADVPESPQANFVQELSLRGSEEPLDVQAIAAASASVEVDGKAVEEPTASKVVQTEAAAVEPEEPITLPVVAEAPAVEEVAEVAQVSVQDQKTETRFQAEQQQQQQFQQQQPQAIAAVQLNQAEITEQILKQAIPNVVNQVSGHIIQQAIPLVVDRAVPQVVYQVGSAVAQQAYKQSEPVQIVTPLNTQHQQNHQKQNEKVFVMYATSAPNNQQFENVFNKNNQYDVAENLVVPIGNRNQQQQQQQQQQQSQFQITRGIQAGSGTQEQRQNTAYFNQHIVSNFQRENALLKQQQVAQKWFFDKQVTAGYNLSMEWELPRNGTCGAKERTGIFTKVDPDQGRVHFVAIAFFVPERTKPLTGRMI